MKSLLIALSLFVSFGASAQGIIDVDATRGDFEVFPAGGNEYEGYRGGRNDLSTNIIACESLDYRPKQCRVPRNTVQVVLIDRNSDVPCIEGRTWGFDGNALWVTNGCRGVFRVVSRQVSRPDYPNYPDRPDRPGRPNRPDFPDRPDRPVRTTDISCSSDDDRYNTCEVPFRIGRADLIRQESKTRCIEGSNWGRTEFGIWVDGGCRGQFRVTEARNRF